MKFHPSHPPSGDVGYGDSVSGLLADAEAGEEGIEDIIGTDFSSDLAEVIQCVPQVAGGPFVAESIAIGLLGHSKRFLGALEGLLAACGGGGDHFGGFFALLEDPVGDGI